MAHLIVISIGLLAIAYGQSPAVSIIPTYPVQEENLTLACTQSPACLLPLRWNFFNTSTANIISSGSDLSDLAKNMSVSVICSNVSVNCNLTMTADRNTYDGNWFCLCQYNQTTATVDISVLVTDVYPVVPVTWEVQSDSQTNLTCNTSCAYPAPNITWSSERGPIEGNIEKWDIPCNGQPDLASSYSSYLVNELNNGDWFNCSAQNVPGRRAVNGQFKVLDEVGNPSVSLSTAEIVGIAVGTACIVAGVIAASVCIMKALKRKKEDVAKASGGEATGTTDMTGETNQDSTNVEFVSTIIPGKEKGVEVKVKCVEPKETAMKAGDVKVSWPGVQQSEAVVLQGSGSDGRKNGILIVEGTWSDGKKGTAVVVKVASHQAAAPGSKTDDTPTPTNGSKLLVKGAQSDNNKKVNALVVTVTWPEGAKGHEVVIKENE